MGISSLPADGAEPHTGPRHHSSIVSEDIIENKWVQQCFADGSELETLAEVDWKLLTQPKQGQVRGDIVAVTKYPARAPQLLRGYQSLSPQLRTKGRMLLPACYSRENNLPGRAGW
jgi:hypothetical protein